MAADVQSSSLSITPLGAGDLIDRAVRFYRQNFWTFVLMAAPPIVVGTLISVGWTILGREVFYTTSKNPYESQIFAGFFTGLGNLAIWFIESVAVLVVMGGASRNFVRHILFQEPITVKATYANVKSRLGGLIGASTIIIFLLSIIGTMIFFFGFYIGLIAVFLVGFALSFSPFLAIVGGSVVGLAATFATLWLFFLIASRFAYVPQVMLVEGQGVFAAIGRSTSLASGNVKRYGALFIFTIIATYSALILLYVPLGWYAYFNGVELFSFDADAIPAWYQIATQFLGQISLILLMPVWMIGLCLLYVDERVRHEGYDIELMAARNLGEIPPLPQNYMNPLHPALATGSAPARQPMPRPASKGHSTLGLD